MKVAVNLAMFMIRLRHNRLARIKASLGISPRAASIKELVRSKAVSEAIREPDPNKAAPPSRAADPKRENHLGTSNRSREKRTRETKSQPDEQNITQKKLRLRPQLFYCGIGLPG